MSDNEIIKQVVRDTLQATPPPYRNLWYTFTGDPDDIGGQAILLVLSLKNFSSFKDSERESIVEWVNVLLTKLNQMGVPCGVTRLDDAE